MFKHTIRALMSLGILMAPFALAQTKIETRPIRPAGVSGQEMFKTYCASCHGLDAKGKGPAAAALKVPATDLTKIAQRNGGKFEKEKIIIGLGMMPESGAHGTTDMPVWGDVFRGSRQNEALVQLRLSNLTDYLEKVQDPPPAAGKPKVSEIKAAETQKVSLRSVPMNDGAEMFRVYCASCHGVDAKGGGPVAKTLKAPPTDLTLLARNSGGKFPANKVLGILGEMPGTDAHGSKEMPVWGDLLRSVDRADAVKLRLSNITDYLKGIQAK